MSAVSSKRVIGVDVGGTFTDLFFLDEAAQRYEVGKVPSTRPDPSLGIRQGITATVADLGEVATIVHGTTVGTNALLERKGARTGLITTEGFRDVLEMRRRDRPQTWGLWGSFEPVIPRDLRLEVPERVLADGTVTTAVDLEAVRAAARTLRERGAVSVCLFFINAYANSENEQRARTALEDVWPNAHITTASEILPEIREFERGSTASLNAYLQPLLGDYLENLQGQLSEIGFAGQILIVQSNGGVMSVETARRLPVRTALSGPAAGVIAGAHIAASAGFPNVITCDMGGTSFDVSLVSEGRSALAAETSSGFGMVVRSEMIEIASIGAGGGSVAWVDRGGLLQIGPESAGSDPGPVCYGQGNRRPTVTDANVVMGRINAARPIGGKLAELDVAAARTAIETEIAAPLGLETMAAAEAIVRVANARMAGALRLVSIERGHDPKTFVAMTFGGGGALHAGALFRDVGLAKALVPRYPGITSALGCVIADMRHDQVHSLVSPLDALDVAAVDREMVDLSGRAEALLAQAGVAFERIDYELGFDMLYQGQTHSIAVPLDLVPNHGTAGAETTGLTLEIIRGAFEAAYKKEYGRLLEGIPIRVMSLRVAVIGRRPRFDLSILAPTPGDGARDPRRGQRGVWIEGAWHKVAVFDRLALPVGAVVEGPAVLEQPDTTTFIEPDLRGEVDRLGNLILSRKEDP